MAKRKEALPETEQSEATLTIELKKAIEDIIFQKKNIARDQEALKEAVTANAEKMGVKPGVLSKRIDLIIKEEEKGGEVKSRTDDLDFVASYFNLAGQGNND
jgi:hypothetical protein